MEKRYTLIDDAIVFNGVTLYRIKALVDFGDVKAGEFGGYIENEENLNQYDIDVYDHTDPRFYGGISFRKKICNAWVYNNAKVYGDAKIYGNAKIRDNSIVYGNTMINDNAIVSDNAIIHGNVRIYDNAIIHGNVRICDDICICGDANICNNNDYYVCKDRESESKEIVFFKLKDGDIGVLHDYSYSTLEEFKNKVKICKDSDIRDKYLTIANVAESKINNYKEKS